MLKIGNLKLQSKLILAPMAGISDLPFRMLNRKFGCELTFVEMINSRSISYKNKKTKQMLLSYPQDSPLGVQLLGCEIKFIQKAMDALKKYKFDILDFNAACPARKVVRRGEGAGLLKYPDKLCRILKEIVKESNVPVTVKIRTGWDKDSVNAKEAAQAAEDAGVSGVFIHGRTRMQGYSGMVDYEAIKVVKKALSIPVIASGDIFSPDLAKKMLDKTGCDGLIIARGSLGNPWLFREITEFLKNGRIIDKPSYKERIDISIEHLNRCVDFYGEKNGVILFRKFFIWYTKGFRNIRGFREESNRVKTSDGMAGLIRGAYSCQK